MERQRERERERRGDRRAWERRKRGSENRRNGESDNVTRRSNNPPMRRRLVPAKAMFYVGDSIVDIREISKGGKYEISEVTELGSRGVILEGVELKWLADKIEEAEYRENLLTGWFGSLKSPGIILNCRVENDRVGRFLALSKSYYRGNALEVHVTTQNFSVPIGCFEGRWSPIVDHLRRAYQEFFMSWCDKWRPELDEKARRRRAWLNERRRRWRAHRRQPNGGRSGRRTPAQTNRVETEEEEEPCEQPITIWRRAFSPQMGQSSQQTSSQVNDTGPTNENADLRESPHPLADDHQADACPDLLSECEIQDSPQNGLQLEGNPEPTTLIIAPIQMVITDSVPEMAVQNDPQDQNPSDHLSDQLLTDAQIQQRWEEENADALVPIEDFVAFFHPTEDAAQQSVIADEIRLFLHQRDITEEKTIKKAANSKQERELKRIHSDLSSSSTARRRPVSKSKRNNEVSLEVNLCQYEDLNLEC